LTRRVILIVVLAITSNVILAAVLPKIDVWTTETARIAVAVAGGHGFSSPFRQPTGPSAWIPPVYPYLLAGIFLVCGGPGAAAYSVAVALNILVHAFTCVLLYRTAGEVFGARVGTYSAYALAGFPLLFYPLVLLHVLGGYGGLGLFISPNVIWYTHLSELAMVLLIWFALHPPHWAVFGATWGIAALLNPTLLVLAPAFAGWQLRNRNDWRYVARVSLLAVLCVAPWLTRNYLAFHQLVFIRDNFGTELRVGNVPGHNGRWDGEVHPDRSDYELGRLRELGEVEYNQASEREAVETIRAHSGEFFRNVAFRMGYWWAGTPLESKRMGELRYAKYLPQLMFSMLAFIGAARAMRGKNRKAFLFVAVMVLYPLIHYVTHTSESLMYQYPMQPEMLALATSAVSKRSTNRCPAALDASRLTTRGR
jgi:hypothetical protein